jgi:hypothetical protein
MKSNVKPKRHYFINDFLDKNEKLAFKSVIKQSGSGPNAATKIQQFMKTNLLPKYFSLNERIRYFNYVQNFLKKIPKTSCLTKKREDTGAQQQEGFTINNVVYLEKKIGRDSKYGVIYKTSVKDMLGRFPIAAKLMEDGEDNRREILLNTEISNKILKNKLSRHFLLCYKSFICRQHTDQVPVSLINKDYHITLNELAIGDLWNLCRPSKGHYNIRFLENDALVLNIILQCLLSVATFHKLGYVHQDCHGGNFLYTKTADTTGYYRYRILGKDYFVKNCGINMMIYDFGLSEQYTGITPLYYDHYDAEFNNMLFDQDNNTNRPFIYDYYDYRNMLRTFWKECCYNSMSYDGQDFMDILMGLTAPNKFHSEDDLIRSICNLFMSDECPDTKIFLDALPDGEKVLNIRPYIIDDTIHLLANMSSSSSASNNTMSISQQSSKSSKSNRSISSKKSLSSLSSSSSFL